MSQHSQHSLAPGDFVILPEQDDWGIGQVQSSIGTIVTVTFEHAGQQVINTRRAHLILAPARDQSR